MDKSIQPTMFAFAFNRSNSGFHFGRNILKNWVFFIETLNVKLDGEIKVKG